MSDPDDIVTRLRGFEDETELGEDVRTAMGDAANAIEALRAICGPLRDWSNERASRLLA